MKLGETIAAFIAALAPIVAALFVNATRATMPQDLVDELAASRGRSRSHAAPLTLVMPPHSKCACERCASWRFVNAARLSSEW